MRRLIGCILILTTERGDEDSAKFSRSDSFFRHLVTSQTRSLVDREQRTSPKGFTHLSRHPTSPNSSESPAAPPQSTARPETTDLSTYPLRVVVARFQQTPSLGFVR